MSFAEMRDAMNPPRPARSPIGWIMALFALVAVAAVAVIEFAPASTFSPPRLGLPALHFALATSGGALPRMAPLDVTRIPLVGDALDRFVNPPARPASPLRVTASGERRTLANGIRVLTVTGTIANPSNSPAALVAIDAALLDASGHAAFRWRIPAPASEIAAHASVGFESVAANFPAGATVLRLNPR